MSRLYPVTMIVLLFICIGFSNGELELKPELSCKNLDDHLAKTVDIKFFLVKRKWYVPLASQYTYRSYAESVLGRPPKDEQELAKMCLRIQTEVDGSNFKIASSGYDNAFYQHCEQAPVKGAYPTDQLRCACNVTGIDKGPKPNFGDYQDDLIMLDGESYVLCVICTHGKHTWKVLSVEPELRKGVLPAIKEKITELGFDPNLMQSLTPCKE